MRKLLIVKMGGTRPRLATRLGDYEDWIAACIGLPGDRVVVRVPPAGALLPHPTELAGAAISGSEAMVTAREEWSERTAAWLGEALKVGIPLMGICYGHQLLAYAAGGTVGDNPGGEELGTDDIHLAPAASEDPLFRQMPAVFPAHVFHAQSVLSLPRSAVWLASSGHDPHQAFRLGRCAWGVQFHPEFPTEVARAYVQESATAEEETPRPILRGVRETPDAARLLRLFGEYVQ